MLAFFNYFTKDDCDIHRSFWAILENVLLLPTGNDLSYKFPRKICEYHSHPWCKLKKANVVWISLV